MSLNLTKRVLYQANERLDLNDKLAEDTLLDATLMEYFRGLAEDDPDGRVFFGWRSTTIVGPNVGFVIAAEPAFAMSRDGRVLLRDGASSLTVSLTADAVNYLHAHYDETSSDDDSRRFYYSGSESSSNVPTRVTRTASLYKSTTAYGTPAYSNFATSANVGGTIRQMLPLYAVAVNASNVITSVTDFRPMWAPQTLGAGGNQYEANVPDVANFTPTDAASIGITNIRTAFVAVTDRIKQLKNTTHWYDDSFGNLQLGGDIYQYGVDNRYTIIAGGLSPTTGANIELYGGTHATQANNAFYDATVHTFRSQDSLTTYAVLSGTGAYAYLWAPTSIGVSSPSANVQLHVKPSSWIVGTPTTALLDSFASQVSALGFATAGVTKFLLWKSTDNDYLIFQDTVNGASVLQYRVSTRSNYSWVNQYQLESVSSLGGTAGNTTPSLLELKTSLVGGNTGYIDAYWLRLATGSTWTYAHWRLQRTIDTTQQGFLGFGAVSGQTIATVELGHGTTTYLTVSDTNGYVGIGPDFRQPAYRLHVYGDAGSVWNKAAIAIENSGSGARKWALSARTTGSLLISDETAGSVRVGIDTNGRVAIGNGGTTTAMMLTVYGTTYVRPVSTGEARYGLFNGGAIAEWFFGQPSGTDHRWVLSKIVSSVETEYFAIDTSGNATFSNGTAWSMTFNGTTSNWLTWSANGVGAPTFTTRSVGTKLMLYNSIGPAAVDYAIGIENQHMWFSAPTSGQGFYWYHGTTRSMSLESGGLLSTATFTATTAVNTPLINSLATTGTPYIYCYGVSGTTANGLLFLTGGNSVSSSNVEIYNSGTINVDSNLVYFRRSDASNTLLTVDTSNNGLAISNGALTPLTRLHVRGSGTILRLDAPTATDETALIITDPGSPHAAPVEGLQVTYKSGDGSSYFNNIYATPAGGAQFWWQKGTYGSGTTLLKLANDGTAFAYVSADQLYDAGLVLENTNGAYNSASGISLVRSGSERARITADYYEGLHFWTTSLANPIADRMRITASGNVCIANTNESGRLNVYGTTGYTSAGDNRQGILASTSWGTGLYFGVNADAAGGATAAIETAWVSGTNPTMALGVTRDGLKANITLDYQNDIELRYGTTTILGLYPTQASPQVWLNLPANSEFVIEDLGVRTADFVFDFHHWSINQSGFLDWYIADNGYIDCVGNFGVGSRDGTLTLDGDVVTVQGYNNVTYTGGINLKCGATSGYINCTREGASSQKLFYVAAVPSTGATPGLMHLWSPLTGLYTDWKVGTASGTYGAHPVLVLTSYEAVGHNPGCWMEFYSTGGPGTGSKYSAIGHLSGNGSNLQLVSWLSGVSIHSHAASIDISTSTVSSDITLDSSRHIYLTTPSASGYVYVTGLYFSATTPNFSVTATTQTDFTTNLFQVASTIGVTLSSSNAAYDITLTSGRSIMLTSSTSGVVVPRMASDPTANVQNGMLYYNTTSNVLKIRAGGTWKTITAA